MDQTKVAKKILEKKSQEVDEKWEGPDLDVWKM
jgi:hypothetical protein